MGLRVSKKGNLQFLKAKHCSSSTVFSSYLKLFQFWSETAVLIAYRGLRSTTKIFGILAGLARPPLLTVPFFKSCSQHFRAVCQAIMASKSSTSTPSWERPSSRSQFGALFRGKLTNLMLCCNEDAHGENVLRKEVPCLRLSSALGM